MTTLKGKKGEDAACRYLKRKGYEILERNKRLSRGELDIVAMHRDILVFVEVKAHKSHEASIMAMHEDKCQRFVSAAETWLGMHEKYAGAQCRFDLIIVGAPRLGILSPEIEHMQDIIRL